MSERIVVLYPGTADATAALAAACGTPHQEVVTLTLDLGQAADLEEIRDRALAAGAVRAHVLDVREEFAREYVLPALRAGAAPDGRQPTVAGLARPLIEKKLAEIAAIEHATPVASVSDVHDNLWGREGSGYTLTKSPADAPTTPAEVEILFERGIPVAINSVEMGLTELIEILSIIAGHHGIGRFAIGSLCVEAPAAVVLRAAYEELEAAAGGQATGSVRIKLLQGTHTVLECRTSDPRSPIPDPHPVVPQS